jgi:Toprim domain
MLAVMRDIHTNEITAVQRTALNETGAKMGRMTLGRKTGAAIKLSADEEVTMGLVIGEGLETVLSAMRLSFNPAWAVGDASNVRLFPILSGIGSLTIIVDNDENGVGQRAALQVRKVLLEREREEPEPIHEIARYRSDNRLCCPGAFPLFESVCSDNGGRKPPSGSRTSGNARTAAPRMLACMAPAAHAGGQCGAFLDGHSSMRK